MIGSGSIGQSAVGELSGGDDTILFVPSVTVSVAAAAPSLNTIVAVGGSNVAISLNAPTLAAGKSQQAPSASVSVQTFVPLISIGDTLFPSGAAAVFVAAPVPQIVAGNVVEANTTVTMITPYGEIASASIGQFAIGEGEVSTRIVKVPPLVIIMASAPMVSAGNSQFPPSVPVLITSPRAEIDSRRRKLRVLAIAS